MQTLKTMSSLSIQQGVNTIFFPGGTRSRSGHIEQDLKLGLLSTCVDAQRELLEAGSDRKVFIVPVVLNYHFVLEAKYLVDEHLRRKGKEKYIRGSDNSQNWSSKLSFIYKLFATDSEVLTSFGAPTDVFGNKVNLAGESIDHNGKRLDIKEYFMRDNHIVKDEQREFVYTKYLGETIAKSYKQAKVVLSSEIVAFVGFRLLRQIFSGNDLFSVFRIATDEFQIPWENFLSAFRDIYDQVIELAQNGGILLQKEFENEVDVIAREGFKKLGSYHAKKPLFVKKGYVYSNNFKLLYYYHNSLDVYDFELKKLYVD
jgi:glycerol-3-phosphate O-acyltransferase